MYQNMTKKRSFGTPRRFLTCPLASERRQLAFLRPTLVLVMIRPLSVIFTQEDYVHENLH